LLDQARGLALVAMIIYHALWDGFQFGLLIWTPERDGHAPCRADHRRVISDDQRTFVGLGGCGPNPTCFCEAGPFGNARPSSGAAILVSAASFIVLPQAPIYFGILHHIALASVVIALVAPIMRFSRRRSPLSCSSPMPMWLNRSQSPGHDLAGLGTQTPVTADWVPAFPWLAAGLAGVCHRQADSGAVA
jgi:uncharacterized membrane protein